MKAKYSASEAKYVLKTAAVAIRQLGEQNAYLRDKLAHLEQRDRSVKLAEQMHGKGIDRDVPIDRLADNLDAMAQQGKFAEWERAVDMVAPDMSVGMALRGEETGTGSSDQLTAWLLGQIG